MMTRALTIVALAAGLTACGSNTPREAAVTTNAAPASDDAARIRALPEGQRQAVLLRAIRDAGRECQHVTQASALSNTAAGVPAWAARCDDGATWIVALNPGGVATVTGAANAGADAAESTP